MDVAPGAVATGTVVTFSSSTPSLTNFRSTTNGTDPTYTVGTAGGNFTVSSNGTVEVVGNKLGWITSAVASFAYTIDPIPTVSSITINTGGTTANIVFSENVTYGAGGTGGWTPTLTGGAATWTYSAGNTTANHTFTINRTVIDTETGTLAYTQPGNGAEDSVGQDLATFSGTSITNNSTQTGVGFVPTDIPGLKIWYQGDSYNGTTGTATDLSGNANHGTQSTSGNRPTHVANEQNGNDVMRFDGSNDFLDITTPFALTSFTIGITIKASPTYATQAIVSGSNGAPELRIKTSEVLAMEKSLNAEIVAGSTDVVSATWRTIIATYDGTTGIIYVDGVSDGSASNAQTFSANLSLIGKNSINDMLSADVMDFVVYESVLSGGNRASLQTFLATRPGL